MQEIETLVGEVPSKASAEPYILREPTFGDFGWIGGSLGFYLGLDNNGANDNAIETGEYEAAIHWRARYGGLGLFARASAALTPVIGRGPAPWRALTGGPIQGVDA
mgnify:CR=1 FL=1